MCDEMHAMVYTTQCILMQGDTKLQRSTNYQKRPQDENGNLASIVEMHIKVLCIRITSYKRERRAEMTAKADEDDGTDL
jgi:hypothetical protein